MTKTIKYKLNDLEDKIEEIIPRYIILFTTETRNSLKYAYEIKELLEHQTQIKICPQNVWKKIQPQQQEINYADMGIVINPLGTIKENVQALKSSQIITQNPYILINGNQEESQFFMNGIYTTWQNLEHDQNNLFIAKPTTPETLTNIIYLPKPSPKFHKIAA